MAENYGPTCFNKRTITQLVTLKTKTMRCYITPFEFKCLCTLDIYTLCFLEKLLVRTNLTSSETIGGYDWYCKLYHERLTRGSGLLKTMGEKERRAQYKNVYILNTRQAEHFRVINYKKAKRLSLKPSWQRL